MELLPLEGVLELYNLNSTLRKDKFTFSRPWALVWGNTFPMQMNALFDLTTFLDCTISPFSSQGAESQESEKTFHTSNWQSQDWSADSLAPWSLCLRIPHSTFSLRPEPNSRPPAKTLLGNISQAEGTKWWRGLMSRNNSEKKELGVA